MKKFMIIFILFIPFIAYSQLGDTLLLENCYKMAVENYPLIRQKALIQATSDLKIRNICTSWYPQINVNGQATYQSAVTEMPQVVPFFDPPTISKDQYKISLDINQALWDGGTTTALKKIETSGKQINEIGVEVELEKIKERINIIYFNIILSLQNKRIVENIQTNLKERLINTEAAVKNGASLSSNADVLKAEIIKTEQQILEIEAIIRSSFAMLKEFINIEVSESSILILPEIKSDFLVYDNQRPELKWYDLQIHSADISKSLTNSKLSPRVYAFGQAGYGRPGLDMLSNDFDYFYIIGAKFTWNISAFYQSGNEKKIADLQKSIISTQRETFEKNLKISSEKDLSDIKKYAGLIDKDQEIIRLRESITKSAAAQMENGVITATQYINELNAEQQARLSLELHKIQWLMSKINYMNSMGKM